VPVFQNTISNTTSPFQSSFRLTARPAPGLRNVVFFYYVQQQASVAPSLGPPRFFSLVLGVLIPLRLLTLRPKPLDCSAALLGGWARVLLVPFQTRCLATVPRNPWSPPRWPGVPVSPVQPCMRVTPSQIYGGVLLGSAWCRHPGGGKAPKSAAVCHFGYPHRRPRPVPVPRLPGDIMPTLHTASFGGVGVCRRECESGGGRAW